MILLAVFLVENQVESHLLQPLVVGRIVRLHPLAIILVLAVGGIVAGHRRRDRGGARPPPRCRYAWPYLRGASRHRPVSRDRGLLRRGQFGGGP